jgi:parallel beta-helix repeat protein
MRYIFFVLLLGSLLHGNWSFAQETIRVAADGSSQYTSLADAVAAAAPGSNIEVYPGTYAGGISIDKQLNIKGVGARDSIIIASEGRMVVTWLAATGTLSNMSLRQNGKCVEEVPCVTLHIVTGAPVVNDIQVDAEGGSAIMIDGAGTSPTITGAVVTKAFYSGIAFVAGSTGVVENSEISAGAGQAGNYAAIDVSERSAPTLRGNKIFNSIAGIAIRESAKGTYENNEIYKILQSGIDVTTEADPKVKNNRIYDNGGVGIMVRKKARGTYENNEITNNGYSGMVVELEAMVTARNNTISKNREYGIAFLTGGGGTFTDNTLEHNASGSWYIESDAGDVQRSGNKD